MQKKIFYSIAVLVVLLVAIFFLNRFLFNSDKSLTPKGNFNIETSSEITKNNWLVKYVVSNNGQDKLFPKKKEKFTFSLNPIGNTVNLGTDCNNMGGNYELDANKIKFGPIFSTQKFCDNSEENLVWPKLNSVESFEIRKYDSNDYLELILLDKDNMPVVVLEKNK